MAEYGVNSSVPDGVQSTNEITVESMHEYYSQIPDYSELDEAEK